MADEEELEMDGWKKLIPGCFGAVDVLFGVHPMDAKRALEMFEAAYSAGATWEEVEAAALEYMKGAGAGEARIAKSLELMRTFPMSKMFNLRHLR
jgi:hypothetical protein